MLIRSLFAACLISSAAVLSYGIVVYNRFVFLPMGVGLRTAVVWAATVAALVALLRRWPANRKVVRALLIAPAVLMGIRYWVPRLFPEEQLGSGGMMTDGPVRAQGALRLIASAQEQYRIHAGSYADSVSKLRAYLPAELADVTLTLTRDGDKWWSGTASVGADSCTIRVGESRGAPNGDLIEGVPRCTGGNLRWAWSSVRGAPFRGQPLHSTAPPGLEGEWLQHRADARRSGRVSSTAPPATWDAWVSGEIRSRPSIAGDQLLIGGHGNGEVASFRLSDGALQWRVRAPNWIHHEPVVRDSLVAYGFGNNERWGQGGEHGGSPPSGFEVVDRRTGTLRWRRLTDSPAMGAPQFVGELLIGIEAGGVLHAWRATDGAEQWHSALPARSDSPMMNPLLVGDLLFVTTEPAKWCAFELTTGVRRSCGDLPDARWGAGHSSPSLAGNLAIFSYAEYPEGDRVFRGALALLRGLLAVPMFYEAVSVVAIEMPSGRLVWRTRLGGLGKRVFGHVAGTPTITGDLAVLPLPLIGEVVAFNIRDGAIQWRARVNPARGSVTALDGRIFSATTDKTFVVLDEQTGKLLCEAPSPGAADRSGLTISGSTGVLAFADGRLAARPVAEWMNCGVKFN